MITKYKIFENIKIDYSNQRLTSLPKLSDNLKE